MNKSFFLLPLLMTLHVNAQENPLPFDLKDSVVTPISTRYKTRSFLHQLIMGKNYRDIWDTPVKLPVLKFSNEGFSIEKLGGGQQTKSLHLLDSNGGHWILRTVDKDVEGAVPNIFRNNLGETVVQDMISASLPYSHTIVGRLAQATGVRAPMPILLYVADDKGLKEYYSLFAGKVCTIEATVQDKEAFDTDEAIQKIAADNKIRVLQKQILKARLLDMLIGDWDRHEDQWQWIELDSAGSKYFYVIPKDRDNALFYATGLFPTFMKFSFMPHMKGFKEESDGLRQLNRKSIGFDAYFLNELDAEDWSTAIREFQQQINDEVVEASIKNTLPENVYARHGETLVKKLKNRRDGLLSNAMQYYRYLSGEVDITGSDKEELFVATCKGKQMLITVYGVEQNKRKKIYERTFHRSETKTIVLNGLKGADQFVIENTAPSNIKLKIFGHEGKDVYTVKGKTNSKIVDMQSENNIVVNKSSAKFKFN